MIRAKLYKILVLTVLAGLLTGVFQSYASEGMYDTLQRDGKLRLIVKFKDFVSDRITFKLGGKDLVLEDNLNEYILKKIDQKYNLKKLQKLFKDRNSANTACSRGELNDYFVIEIDKDEKYAEWVTSRLEQFYEIDMVEPDMKVNIAATPLPDVNYIPNDYYVSTDGSNWATGAFGQSYPNMWGLQKTQVFEAWDLFADAQNHPGKDMVVAVIDTGVDFSHADIGANKWVNSDEIPNNGVDDDGNGYIDDINGWDFVSNDNDPQDGHGHGTHCSGTIAGVTNNTIGVAGIAPNAKIMAVKGLSDSGSGYISWLSNCIIYAADNEADILSNSWGGSGSSSTLNSAMNYAYSKGCVIVAAAGNSNADVSGFTPANIPCVIAVAATDSNDVKASFSNYGETVDVSAPGVSILSTTGSSYASWSGTSMACPHVSGVAALILSNEPTLTNAEVRQRLRDTADDINAQNPSWQGLLGTGRINAYKAVLAGGPVNHPPILDPIGNRLVTEGEQLSFVVSATDSDGDSLIYSVFDNLPGDLARSGNADFFVQSANVYEGEDALQSGAINENQFCAVTKEINLVTAGTLSFYWKVSSKEDSGILAFYIDNIKQVGISGALDWHKEEFSLSSGAHTLKWVYSRSNAAAEGEDTGWIDKITISQGVTLNYDFEDGLMPAGFKTGGDGYFYVTDFTPHQGGYALMADPSITDNDYEYVQKTIDVTRATVLTFWWKVSSEYYYDFLEFYIDGILQDRISGYTSWQLKTCNLSAGTHTLKWQYTKDYSVTWYDDTGWIDDIVIDGGGEEVIDFESAEGDPNPLPDGATFNANTRTFSWEPSYSQAGTYPGIRFIITEDTEEARTDYEDITIAVLDRNLPPALNPIGNKIINEMESLVFAVSATDPEGDALTYSASNLPAGAIFDAETRTFSWIPTYQQSGVYQNVHFEVGDEASSESALDENTKLLLHCNGEDGSTDFRDDSLSANTVTAYGTAHLSTAVKKFGSSSAALNGYADYLIIPDSDDWNIQDNFTIDLWVRHTDHSGPEVYIGQIEAGNKYWKLGHCAPYGVYFIMENGSSGITLFLYGGEITDADWHHVALIKTGDEYGLYKDGQQVSYLSDSDMATFEGALNIGNQSGVRQYFDGYIDEIRIAHNNAFNATPDSELIDTITVPTIEYSAEEGGASPGGNIDSEDIAITVVDVNHAPVLNAIGYKSVNEGELLAFTISATDINGDTLTYSATNLPSSAIFDLATGAFSWTPAYDEAGTYSDIIFTVSDSALLDSETITITVNNTSAPPVLASIGDKAVNEGALLEFTISATDSDEDVLTYSASNLPTGASFDAGTQTFSWTPDYADSGTYSDIIFTVSDGSLTDEESITITVVNVNRWPVITGLTITPSSTIAEGKGITIAIDVSDPDGDSITYQVQNGPDGSGFVNNDFYWVPGYDQAGTYSGITFTVFDGALYSDPSDSVAITVTNVNDPPEFITAPAIAASYNDSGGAEDVAVTGGYAYVAYGSGGIKVLDISNLNNITEVDAISSYNNLNRICIIEDYAYVIDSGRLVEILDIAAPSMPEACGNMAEEAASDIAVYDQVAYLACGNNTFLYDLTDKDSPLKLIDYDLGKADKIIIKEGYGYAISADEDLKMIDVATAEILSTDAVAGAEGYDVKDIGISGNSVYVAKDGYGIVAFDAEDPVSPSLEGEFNKPDTAIKEIETHNKDRLFSMGYISATDNYDLIYVDTTDPAAMTELWTYSFAEGLAVNSLYSDGNRLFVADEDGLKIVVAPLETNYTVEEGDSLKIAVYAQDPDQDSIVYTMNNKPDFDEAVFTDNSDGTATFTWTPTEDQIGTYADISFTVSDAYQETLSNSIIISVVERDITAPPLDENTKLLLHCNGEDGSTDFRDDSLSANTVTAYGTAHLSTAVKKFGSSSAALNGYADYLIIPDSDDWNIQDNFTIDLWVRHTDHSGPEVYIGQIEAGNKYWKLGHCAPYGVYFIMENGSSGITLFLYGGEITDADWHHVALIKTGDEYGLYKDGQQVSYLSDSDMATFEGALNIGNQSGVRQYFDGYIDEIRIAHNNAFNATPDSELIDTITVRSREY